MKDDLRNAPDTPTVLPPLRPMVFASLLAAFTAAGAFIAIPIGPIPIVLQNLFIFLSGLLLGPRWGAASVGIYLLAGVCGLPVFAGGTGGPARLIGPTGGYLMAFLPAVWLIGAISARGRGRLAFDVLAMATGTIVIYTCGVGWLKILTGMTILQTLTVGMFPFLLGDLLKIGAALPIARILRPIVRNGSEGNAA